MKESRARPKVVIQEDRELAKTEHEFKLAITESHVVRPLEGGICGGHGDDLEQESSCCDARDCGAGVLASSLIVVDRPVSP